MANVSLLNTTASLTGKTVATLEGSLTYTGANTFTGANVFNGGLASGSSTAPSMSFDAEAGLGFCRSAVSTFSITSNNVINASFGYGVLTGPFGTLPAGAYGATAGLTGPTFTIGYNSSGSGCPGQLALQDKAGTSYYLWVSSTGKLYLGTAPVQADGTPNDTSGTIVGTQS